MTNNAQFNSQDADAWYARNNENLKPLDVITRDPVFNLMRQYIEEIGVLVDIGAANGWRTEMIRRVYDCGAFAIEISEVARAAGEQLYPQVNFARSVFDGWIGENILMGKTACVVASYVLHWIPRSSLLLMAVDIDKLLKDGGYLLINDFDAPVPEKVVYHHRPSLWTYHLDYAAIFLATGGYREVARVTYDYEEKSLPVQGERQRGVCVLLQKGDQYRICE